MKENNKKYNAVDFIRYHSGIMSPDEMQALEKAALEDPFLADALDGYALSKDHEKDLEEIKMRLDEKRKKQKVFTISSLSSGNWWKIAAMFILFAGVGYFFYAVNSKRETSLVIKKEAAKNENVATISPTKNDTTVTEDNLAFEKGPSNKNGNNIAKLPLPTTRSIEAPPDRRTLPGEIRTGKEKKTEEYLAQNKEKTNTMKNSDKALSSNILLKDSGEKSFFNSPDTIALVAASADSYNPDNKNAAVMNKKNEALSEVVVTGYETKRKKNITGVHSDKLEGKVSGVNVSTSAPYPKEGKEKFDQYITDHALPVFDSAGKRIISNVLLSFTLNKKGKPAHIKVLESSCEACEKEAIRLLKNGPDWIGKRGDSGTVRIQF